MVFKIYSLDYNNFNKGAENSCFMKDIEDLVFVELWWDKQNGFVCIEKECSEFNLNKIKPLGIGFDIEYLGDRNYLKGDLGLNTKFYLKNSKISEEMLKKNDVTYLGFMVGKGAEYRLNTPQFKYVSFSAPINFYKLVEKKKKLAK